MGWKGKRECDFVVKEGTAARDAVQVSYSLKETGTRKRELEGLLEAMREFNLKKGTILAFDESESIAVEGVKIEVVPVWQWLLR